MNQYGRSLDKTYLSCDNAEDRGFIHRDYIAHCLRWTHVVKYLTEKQRYKTASILDVGCGKEAPLIKTLYSSRLLPAYYVGIDAGKIQPKITFSGKESVHFLGEANFLDISPTEHSFAIVVMFEVLEHVELTTGIKLLEHIQQFMNKDSVFFMSTPCFNGSAAANHVHEWTYQDLKNQLHKLYVIEDHWGTFASIRDYEPYIKPELREVFNELRGYYDVNYLATVFAPLFPEYARNVLWKLRLR